MNDLTVVTATTAGFTHWTLHLLRNLRFLGLHRRLTVCAFDEESIAFASAHNLSIHSTLPGAADASKLATAVSSIKGSSKYRRVFKSTGWFSAVHLKQECVWNVMMRSPHNSVTLLIDGDVSLFRDPILALSRASGPQLPDLMFLNDETPSAGEAYMNSGFMVMRNTYRSRTFGKVYLDELRRRRGANDQGVLNDCLGIGEGSKGAERHRALNTSGGLAIHVLNSREFMNGFFFYEYRDQRPLNASSLVAVHHNWIRGDRNKWNRAVAYDTILQSDGEKFAHFRRRARRSMRNMEAWKYRNKSHAGNEFCGQSGPGC
mmetsp:Transcript_26419/g.67041  ORF Transcript_26419/g.67041 Transcript_26419/m.67041 type:complete len:317 (+) Transcript_26419:157-1107(+)